MIAGACKGEEAGAPRYRRATRVLWRGTPDGVLVLPLDASEVLSVSGPGRVLWELLADPVTLDEAGEILASEYDVPLGEIAPSIEAVLEELCARGAVETVGP